MSGNLKTVQSRAVNFAEPENERLPLAGVMVIIWCLVLMAVVGYVIAFKVIPNCAIDAAASMEIGQITAAGY